MVHLNPYDGDTTESSTHWVISVFAPQSLADSPQLPQVSVSLCSV